VAWVSVGREERDPQAFWLSVLDSLRETGAGSEGMRELTADPRLDGAAVVDRLIEDLGALREPLWLVIDDLQELRSQEALDQLGLLLADAPPELRLVLLTRRDLRLGLHRLRVEGELTEIRGEDLRFSLQESRALMDAAGVGLSDNALESLVAVTEGWAAGLRLVALSLARHPDPERYAAGFSGRQPAVAEYLRAEVLERLPADVRRLLLLTPVHGFATTTCSRICSRSSCGAPRRRSYRGCTRLRPGGFQSTGMRSRRFVTLRQPRTGGLAARLLADNWFGFELDGRLATAHELLSRFPAERIAADPEVALLAAGDKRMAGSLQEAVVGNRGAAAGFEADSDPLGPIMQARARVRRLTPSAPRAAHKPC
jgi:LuxR family transcriptional regulator, maltose regulon positive regulatory protein